MFSSLFILACNGPSEQQRRAAVVVIYNANMQGLYHGELLLCEFMPRSAVRLCVYVATSAGGDWGRLGGESLYHLQPQVLGLNLRIRVGKPSFLGLLRLNTAINPNSRPCFDNKPRRLGQTCPACKQPQLFRLLSKTIPDSWDCSDIHPKFSDLMLSFSSTSPTS